MARQNGKKENVLTGNPFAHIRSSVIPDAYGPDDVISKMMEDLFTRGTYTCWAGLQQRNVLHASPLAPEDATLERVYSGYHLRGSSGNRQTRQELWRGKDWEWLLHAGWEEREGTAVLTALASSQAAAEEVLAAAAKRFVIKETQPTETELTTRFRSSNGSTVRHRIIDLIQWQDIARNYPASVRPQLAQLAALKPDQIHGQLIVIYGPVGTGKTAFLHSLLYEWQDWCTAEVIADPEVMFNDAGYLMSAIVGSTPGDDFGEDPEKEDKWRLLILEDAGDLFTGSSQNDMSQALARLLNLADGLLGRGLRLLVAITSNDDFTTYHPAVTRNGRRLATLHLPPFPYREAKTWMGENEERLSGEHPYTLADLYALRNGTGITTDPAEQVGQYL